MTKTVQMTGLLIALAACAGGPEDLDELAGESAADGDELGKADWPGPSPFTYYRVEPDIRRCAWPYCGGKWVSRLNRAYTLCATGGWAERCYVVDLDLSALGLSEAQESGVRNSADGNTVVLRGDVVRQRIDGIGTFGQFRATEAWLAEMPAIAEGVFTRVTDTGLECIAYPCVHYHEQKINSLLYAHIADLDFTPSGAAEDNISKALDAARSEDGLIVAGERYWVDGPAGEARARTVTNFYRRVHAERSAECFVGGCSGQMCLDNPDDGFSTCEWRDEYACYRDATCARQADGRCGWTETAELTACLADPPTS